MKKTALFMVMMIMLGMLLPAIESGQYRLLSHSDSQKWILVSQSIGKPRYILDASTAKITVDGKPAEFKDLDRFAVLNVKFEFKKFKKDGVDIDGVVSEIRILTPEQPTKKQYPILAPKESRH